jgi:hypothetical protein
LLGKRQLRHAVLGGPNRVVGFLASIPLRNRAAQELMLSTVPDTRVTAVVAQFQFHVGSVAPLTEIRPWSVVSRQLSVVSCGD